MSPGDSTVLFRALPPPLKFSIDDQMLLIKFASLLAEQVADRRSFICLVTNDRALRKLNHQFLGNNYATDVLSFPAGEGEAVKGSCETSGLGDLAISIERAEAQALAFGHTRLAEVRILMLHGLLHLLGFDHETDRGQMARAERKWRTHFELPSTLIARTKQRVAS